MSNVPFSRLEELHLVGLSEIGKRWKWIVGLGAVMAVLGAVAIGASVFVTLATMIFIGSLMLVGGILQMVHAIGMRGWSGFFLDLVAALLYMVVGFMIVAHPGATAAGLTLLIAVFLIMGGLFRIATGIAVAYHNRAWLILHGLINLMLGFIIWKDWPVSGLWVIGLFIGLDMLFNGWSLIVMGLAVKKLAGTK